MQTQLTLTQEIEIVDDIDKFLLEDILLIVQNTQILEIVKYWGHEQLKIDKTEELFLKKILLSVNALVKANALRRNYHKVKDILIEDVKKDSTIQDTRIDMLFNKVDAFILIEAFFGQIKTSLDLLAQSLKPIYGQEFHTWERKNDISGMKIVDVLSRNLNNNIKPHAEAVSNLIKDNAESITKIVAHRDSTVHYGKLKNVQGFRYSVSKKEVYPPIILVAENETAYVHEYMDEVLKYISEFIQLFIITLLSNLINDMVIAKNMNGEWGWRTHLPKN
ncbi:MAG: hypothetical protein WC635_18180 [Bacteriovorax sp.]